MTRHDRAHFQQPINDLPGISESEIRINIGLIHKGLTSHSGGRLEICHGDDDTGPSRDYLGAHPLKSAEAVSTWSPGQMSVWQICLRRVALRMLELILLQFLVVVILPDNAVGTQDLPAVGAKKVVCSADDYSVAPSSGEPSAVLDLFAHQLATCAGDDSPAVSRHAAGSAADVLQLSRRLRI